MEKKYDSPHEQFIDMLRAPVLEYTRERMNRERSSHKKGKTPHRDLEDDYPDFESLLEDMLSYGEEQENSGDGSDEEEG